MLSENWKILLDYKSERKVTNRESTVYKNIQNITGYYRGLGRQTAGETDANALAQLYRHYHYNLYFYPASIDNVTDCFHQSAFAA